MTVQCYDISDLVDGAFYPLSVKDWDSSSGIEMGGGLCWNLRAISAGSVYFLMS